MSRFFVAPENIADGAITITGPDVRHITRVLRLGAGDELTVVDGQGREYEARIKEYSERVVLCEIISSVEVNREAPVEVTLVQGLPKGDKMELIIQKCTELGVTRIIPVTTTRTVVRLEGRKAQERRERWQRVAAEASKQARRSVVPSIEEIVSLKEALSGLSSDVLAIMPWEEENSTGIKEILQRENNNKKIYIFIGPEGGLTPEEADMAREKGVITVTMGPRIMRTETAGFAAVTMVLYQLGDLGG